MFASHSKIDHSPADLSSWILLYVHLRWTVDKINRLMHSTGIDRHKREPKYQTVEDDGDKIQKPRGIEALPWSELKRLSIGASSVRRIVRVPSLSEVCSRSPGEASGEYQVLFKSLRKVSRVCEVAILDRRHCRLLIVACPRNRWLPPEVDCHPTDYWHGIVLALPLV